MSKRSGPKMKADDRIPIAFIIVSMATAIPATAVAQTVDSVHVMTYNILAGGAKNGPLSRTVGVINTSQADIIGLQEAGTISNVQTIANALGFFHHRFTSSVSILSRYPIVSAANQGVLVQLSPTQQAYVFDVHLVPDPYGPYQIQDEVPDAEVLEDAQYFHVQPMSTQLNAMSSALASGLPVFLTGDFNEPSHLDWTAEAAATGLHFSKEFAWPTSITITNAGMVDAFRELRPDEINDPGNTWTPGDPPPTIPNPNEVHDRIDMVYYAGEYVAATSATNYGYDVNDGSTDVGIQPYPSDHRAVVVEFALNGDFNDDNVVNAADFVALRKLIGTQSAFDLWKKDFGATVGAGASSQLADSGSTVPEPSSVLLFGIALASIVLRSRNQDH